MHVIPRHRASHRLRIQFAALLFVAVGLSGCNNGPSAGPSTVDKGAAVGSATAGKTIDTNREFKKLSLSKFAGRVTIDGQPPKQGCKVFLILNDPNHLDENCARKIAEMVRRLRRRRQLCVYCVRQRRWNARRQVGCDFPGVARSACKGYDAKKSSTGKTASGLGGGGGSRNQRYMQPDELKNLYSDPDTNTKDQRFSLDLQPPGKEDYHFDLAVAGKTAAKCAACREHSRHPQIGRAHLTLCRYERCI